VGAEGGRFGTRTGGFRFRIERHSASGAKDQGHRSVMARRKRAYHSWKHELPAAELDGLCACSKAIQEPSSAAPQKPSDDHPWKGGERTLDHEKRQMRGESTDLPKRTWDRFLAPRRSGAKKTAKKSTIKSIR